LILNKSKKSLLDLRRKMVKDYSIERIRNFGVVSHGEVGKTSLIEAMLYSAGATTRLGNIDDGTTVTDYTQEEIDRKITISASLAFAEWKKHKLNVMDTPGYSDFIGEVISALRVVESAIVLLNASAGVEVGTESAWKIIQKNNLPAFIFINRMDKEHANFDQTLEMAQERFGSAVVPLQFPVNQGENFDSVIDLIKMKMLVFKKDSSGKYTESEIPADLLENATDLRKQLEESIAENDEELMEKYFETEKLEEDELLQGLRKEVINQNIIPVLCGAASENLGVSRLMDTMVNFAPSPRDGVEIKGTKPDSDEEIIRQPDPADPFSALVFKTVTEQHMGELSFFRVYSGSLKSGEEVLNTTTRSNEKIGQMFFMSGKRRTDCTEIGAGDIGAVVKLKKTHTSDTLSDKKKTVVLKEIEFPAAVIRTAVQPKNKGDDEKINIGLGSMHGEDPTFQVKYDTEVRQMVMSGQGELQFDIIVKRLKEKFGVEVEMIQPKIPYRETIRKKVEVQGKYKKQSGGRGQYGDCHLRIEPLPRGEGFVFADEVVGGAIPSKYIPAIEKVFAKPWLTAF